MLGEIEILMFLKHREFSSFEVLKNKVQKEIKESAINFIIRCTRFKDTLSLYCNNIKRINVTCNLFAIENLHANPSLPLCSFVLAFNFTFACPSEIKAKINSFKLTDNVLLLMIC